MRLTLASSRIMVALRFKQTMAAPGMRTVPCSNMFTMSGGIIYPYCVVWFILLTRATWLSEQAYLTLTGKRERDTSCRNVLCIVECTYITEHFRLLLGRSCWATSALWHYYVWSNVYADSHPYYLHEPKPGNWFKGNSGYRGVSIRDMPKPAPIFCRRKQCVTFRTITYK